MSEARASERERTLAYGLDLGLDAVVVEHVIDVWVATFRARPQLVDWPKIRTSLVAAAAGNPWRPL